jgi:peptidoglycan/xylan/chitin deacetylase (PgdA/CDA1 family)
MAAKPPFLQYHKIDVPTPDVKIRGAFTSPKRFAKQLAYLRKIGVTFYTASEMIEHFTEYGRFPERGLSITFDDGWKDNYVNAFPVLKGSGIRATIFLVPGCIGRTTDKVTAEGEGPREHLSEEDIREMSAAGVEMGSHSFNHLLFSQIDRAQTEAEMSLSKKYIENLVQKECKVFAYPAGFFTDIAKDIAKTIGYAAAFTTCYGPEDSIDLFAVNRMEILRRDRYPLHFSNKIKSLIQT